MNVYYPVDAENDFIASRDKELIEAGVMDEDQSSIWKEASPQDLSWLPTEAQ
ncbi:hypothetical protein RYA05_05925 [Pseudomonas syringae pv. actinidiae]|nr:hypothetical protein [Pseudomonas syringae pv. actinidiae]